MDQNRVVKQGEIYRHFKDKLYQIVAIAVHTETGEKMVVYQALYGTYGTYVRPMDMFLSEVDKEKYPQVKQKYRFELMKMQDGELVLQEQNDNVIHINSNASENIGNMNSTIIKDIAENISSTNNTDTKDKSDYITLNGNRVQEDNLVHIMTEQPSVNQTSQESVNTILIQFLDAGSYSKKLEVLTSNTKHLNDRLVNDMAVALDCTVDEGPLELRIQGLINCLQAMRRFEDRRLR